MWRGHGKTYMQWSHHIKWRSYQKPFSQLPWRGVGDHQGRFSTRPKLLATATTTSTTTGTQEPWQSWEGLSPQQEAAVTVPCSIWYSFDIAICTFSIGHSNHHSLKQDIMPEPMHGVLQRTYRPEALSQHWNARLSEAWNTQCNVIILWPPHTASL